MIKSHLDKVYDLGFSSVITWNESYSIVYENTTNSIMILYCEYPPDSDHEEIIGICIDIFYEWYNKCSNLIDGDIYEMEDTVPGNITKRVIREQKLDSLL